MPPFAENDMINVDDPFLKNTVTEHELVYIYLIISNLFMKYCECCTPVNVSVDK